MENLNCKLDNVAECCQKLLNNSTSMEVPDFMYSYLYACALNGNSYIAFLILVSLL